MYFFSGMDAKRYKRKQRPKRLNTNDLAHFEPLPANYASGFWCKDKFFLMIFSFLFKKIINISLR